MKLISLSLLFLSIVAASPKAEKEVNAAMDAYKQAMLKRDAAALDRLFHPDLIYSHSSGRAENKQQSIEAATKGTNVTEAMDLSDVTIHVYGKTALVRCTIAIRSNNGSGPQTLRLSVLHVWLRVGNGWQMVSRQSTRLNP